MYLLIQRIYTDTDIFLFLVLYFKRQLFDWNDLFEIKEDINSIYTKFMIELVSCVAGRKKWTKEVQCIDLISGVVTPSDEAFALLLMKEGVGEVEKAEGILQQAFGRETTKGIRRMLRQQTVGAQ